MNQYNIPESNSSVGYSQTDLLNELICYLYNFIN